MPKVAKELSALEVKRLTSPGMHTVGGVTGLYLAVNQNMARSWILRTKIGGKRKEIGLGSYPTVTLAAARDLARETFRQISDGRDPVEERKAQKSAAARDAVTFEDAFRQFFDEKRASEFSNAKHRAQWASTVESYALPVIGSTPVAKVALDDVLKVLQPIWLDKTETASRLRGRLENVLSWATVSGLREGENPARWKGNLDQLLPSPNKIRNSENWPAVRLSEVSGWYALVRARTGMATSALQLLTLTASRSQEIRKARWSEIDFDSAMWIVPAAHMKMNREHRVPLSQAALRLLRGLPRMQGSEMIFPSSKGDALSDMTISAVMRRINEAENQAGRLGFLDARTGRPAVPHGLRSTFRDWAAEMTDYPSDMAEIALAHRVGTKVEQAYRRSDMIEKRRQMMEDWAGFLCCKKSRELSP